MTATLRYGVPVVVLSMLVPLACLSPDRSRGTVVSVPPGALACQQDGDCMIRDQVPCCPQCPAEPYAISRRARDAWKADCADVICNAPSCHRWRSCEESSAAAGGSSAAAGGSSAAAGGSSAAGVSSAVAVETTCEIGECEEDLSERARAFIAVCANHACERRAKR